MAHSAPALALMILRLTLGIFLLQWGIEKFMVPENTPVIWGYFYGIGVPITAAYVFGLVEILLAICFVLGLGRTVASATGALLHAVGIAVSIPFMLSHVADQASHLLIVGVPGLGGFVALVLMRCMDTWRVGSSQA